MSGSSQMDRDRSLSARPVQTPPVKRKERDNGGLEVTVELARPRWQRMLGASDTFERTFGLDVVGRWVYERCDGKASVKRICQAFAKEYGVSFSEAEIAITKFFRTMLTKGVIAMEVDRTTGKGSAGKTSRKRKSRK